MGSLQTMHTPNGSVDTVLRRTGSPDEEEQQVMPVARTAGGKGHNAARCLAADDQEIIACGFMGGWAGREMEALLRAAMAAAVCEGESPLLPDPSRVAVLVSGMMTR